MTAENKPQTLEEFNKELHDRYTGADGQEGCLRFPITGHKVVITHQGTSIVMDPTSHEELVVENNKWWINQKSKPAVK